MQSPSPQASDLSSASLPSAGNRAPSMANFQATADGAPPKLLESLKGYLNCWIGLLKTRVELISTELEEERERLCQIVLIGLASGFFLSMGVITLTFLIVAAFWEHRVPVLIGFTLLYLGAGVAAAWAVRRKIKARPKLFSATIAELTKDQQHLSSRM